MYVYRIYFFIITSTLSLNHYGDTALEITVDEVILGKSLDAKIYLGKYFNVKDEVEETVYGETVDSDKIDIIWKKKIVVNQIKEEDGLILQFSFDEG